MGRKLRVGREGRLEAVTDVGARTVSLRPFDSNTKDPELTKSAVVNAARVDADGSRLAVATSDGVVRVIGVQFPDITYKIAELIVEPSEDGREFNVWDVAWGATDNFGPVLASCSEDRKVRVWREAGEEWVKWFEWDCEEKAGNSLRWAPSYSVSPNSSFITLAVGCSDGSVLVMKHADKQNDESGWVVQSIPSAHSNGVTVVSWGPNRRMTKDSSTASKSTPLLITGGGDTLVKMWVPGSQEGGDSGWERESKLEGHQDWISDLSWAPGVGVRVRHLLASAGRDKKVILWNQPSPSAVWVPMLLTTTHEIPWSLSFSITGHMLSVAEADGRMTLWRESQGSWEEIRYAKKIRDYQETMRTAKAALAVSKQPSSIFNPDTISASGDSELLPKDSSSLYPRDSETSAYKPDDYNTSAVSASAANPWSAAGYGPYADYYDYYAKYAAAAGGNSGQVPKDYRSMDYYERERGDSRAYPAVQQQQQQPQQPQRQGYPYYESTPVDPYSSSRKQKYDYEDYPRSSSSAKDRSYRPYRDERY